MPTSERNRQLAKTRSLRAARAKRREEMLEAVVSGAERGIVARKYGVSLKTVQREVDRALDQRRPDTPVRYVRLQVERLTRALQSIDHAIDAGDIDAVSHLLKVIDKLDRYHGLSSAREAAEAASRLVASTPPLALTHEQPDLCEGK
jgi:hypothetical protein